MLEAHGGQPGEPPAATSETLETGTAFAAETWNCPAIGGALAWRGENRLTFAAPYR
jgi:hypothetical protein